MGQWSLVILGTTMSLSTRPLSMSMRGRVPVMSQTTSVSSTSRTTLLGTSILNWKSDGWGSYTLSAVSVGVRRGKTSTVLAWCYLGSWMDVRCIKINGWSKGLTFSTMVFVVESLDARCMMGQTTVR